MKTFFQAFALWLSIVALSLSISAFIKGCEPSKEKPITNKIIQITTSDKHGILALDNEGNIFAFSLKQRKWVLVADKNTKVVK